MSLLMLELLAIAVLTALVCVIPGVFLVLRGVSLMSDAISHALLLGIVCVFLVVESLTSPLLLVGAAVAGFAVVLLTEYVIQKFQLPQDAAIGLFFPFFFSCAVLLISCCARDVHLDVDMVLLGDLVFAPFLRTSIGGIDVPQAVLLIGILLIISCLVMALWYRSLVITIFDALFAWNVSLSVSSFYYGMMFLTSAVAVSVFSVVGSVVVVALMIVPAATAYCTARSVQEMLVHAALYSVTAAVCGYAYAAAADVSIAGSIALMTGIIFMLVVLAAPRAGIIGRVYHYGIVWLKTCVALVTKHNDERVLKVNELQKLYGWSALWSIGVLWYGVYIKKFLRVKNSIYVNINGEQNHRQ